MLVVIGVVPALYVVEQALSTLQTLTDVERERDTWQRPADVIASLSLQPGNVVVDLGSGAGYFALKLAPVVGRSGRVLAVDLRRESLAFLWIRATTRRLWNVDVINGDTDDPRLPAGSIDAVLIANTYHELTQPRAILAALRAQMRQRARLVVLDRAPRAGNDDRESRVIEHEMSPSSALADISR